MNADIVRLTHAVVADPADDLVRLAYADACEEAGHALRAEFVRLQLRLARGKCAVLPVKPLPNRLFHGDTLNLKYVFNDFPWARAGDLVPLEGGLCVPIDHFLMTTAVCHCPPSGTPPLPPPEALQDPADRDRELTLVHDPAATWLPPGWVHYPTRGVWLPASAPYGLFHRGFLRAARLPGWPSGPLPPVASGSPEAVKVTDAAPRRMPFGGEMGHPPLFGWLSDAGEWKRPHKRPARRKAQQGLPHVVPEAVCRHLYADKRLGRVIGPEGVWFVGEEGVMPAALSDAILAWSALAGYPGARVPGFQGRLRHDWDPASYRG